GNLVATAFQFLKREHRPAGGEVLPQACQFADGVRYIAFVLHEVTAVATITDCFCENMPCPYGFVDHAEHKRSQLLRRSDLAIEAILPNVSDHATSAFVEIAAKSNCALQITHLHRFVMIFLPGL